MVAGNLDGTCVGEEDVQFEGLPFYHLDPGTWTGGRQSTCDGVYPV